MSEKRGYPNPNYTEEDVYPSCGHCNDGYVRDIQAEMVLDDQLIQYIQKASMFDCLVSAIRSMKNVDTDVVQAITGTWDLKEESEAAKFSQWWREERAKNEELLRENTQLMRDNQKLQEQINQLLPAVEEEEASGEGANE